MASWADIQRLASDLQRVQLSQSSKKLSEANCIEVITKLIANSQIDVIFTRDGRSYVTKKHLETEVKNECLANGGRVALTDVATSLNIDYDHVERTAKIVVKDDESFKLSSAELFSTEYVHHLRNELRELLNEKGYQTNTSLCKHWNLSPELLQTLLIENLKENFQGVVDADTIYTNVYLNSRKFILRSILCAITKITPITGIQKKVGLTEKRFWAAFDELLKEDEVPGHIVGSRSSPACVYTPDIYDMLVKSCITASLTQDEFLSRSSLKKLGIDGKQSLESVIGKSEVGKLVELGTLFMTKNLYDLCLSTLEEELEKSGICEVKSAVQSLNIPLDLSDEDQIGEKVASKVDEAHFSQGYVFKSSILKEALKSIESKIEERAHEEVDRMEKEKKQGGKPSKSADGDDWGEKKGKGGKKGKGKSSNAAKSNNPAPVGIADEDLENWLKDCNAVPEEILEIAVEKLSTEAVNILRQKVAHILSTQLTANAATAKKSLVAMADKIKQLYNSFCTFEVATTSFSDPLGSDLRQYLLKSIGTELANAVLSYATGTDNAHLLKEKQRDETIESLQQNLKEPMKELFNSLKSSTESNLDAFHDAIYDVGAPSATSLSLRKADKKTRAEVGANLCAELSKQLDEQQDAATCLLLAVLFILAKCGKPTTASGKFVASLIAQIKDDVNEEMYTLLTSCQKGVVTCIKNKDDEVSKEMLDADIAKLKEDVKLI